MLPIHIINWLIYIYIYNDYLHNMYVTDNVINWLGYDV